MPRKSPPTLCEGCGKMKAGGGQRFCWACLVTILANRVDDTSPQDRWLALANQCKRYNFNLKG